MRIFISLVFLTLSINSFAQGQVKKISVNIDGKTYYCSETGRPVPPEYRCVKKCTDRYSDGRCYKYAKDHCGYDAACTKVCLRRYSDGRCYDYGPDHCSP